MSKPCVDGPTCDSILYHMRLVASNLIFNQNVIISNDGRFLRIEFLRGNADLDLAIQVQVITE
jgi:hypothetical protein